MAVESSFNPFAQSNVGAQGLMQVMTKVHDDKYVAFGGSHAAFDPVTQPARRRPGAEGMHQPGRRPRSAACATTSAPPTPATTAAMLPRCWPSRASCAAIAAGKARRTGCARAARRRGAGHDPGRADSRRRRRGGRTAAAAACPTSSRSCSDPAARPAPVAPALRYTFWAARLAMRLRRSPRWIDHREARSAPARQAPVEPFAWASLHTGSPVRDSSLKDGLPCSTAPNPPSPTSTPSSRRSSSARTGARKSTSS